MKTRSEVNGYKSNSDHSLSNSSSINSTCLPSSSGGESVGSVCLTQETLQEIELELKRYLHSRGIFSVDESGHLTLLKLNWKTRWFRNSALTMQKINLINKQLIEIKDAKRTGRAFSPEDFIEAIDGAIKENERIERTVFHKTTYSFFTRSNVVEVLNNITHIIDREKEQSKQRINKKSPSPRTKRA